MHWLHSRNVQLMIIKPRRFISCLVHRVLRDVLIDRSTRCVNRSGRPLTHFCHSAHTKSELGSYSFTRRHRTRTIPCIVVFFSTWSPLPFSLFCRRWPKPPNTMDSWLRTFREHGSYHCQENGIHDSGHTLQRARQIESKGVKH